MRDPAERAARIICRRCGAPADQWPRVADTYAVANLALVIAWRDLGRAIARGRE